ncbi:uncharacterized protein NPIL_673481 [Nephila pilipes]|uniref:Uncharacterized protein n=1 Tax=Nephila pilipes TaxID=299642 RepID=A0A8X6Q3L7_NEPPI|nr:uncharacterized protein NPIL_161241 [Nephila pilipes]GFU31048.1 uncharacterized protein NPIL_673481 [Nephila pilipes]
MHLFEKQHKLKVGNREIHLKTKMPSNPQTRDGSCILPHLEEKRDLIVNSLTTFIIIVTTMLELFGFGYKLAFIVKSNRSPLFYFCVFNGLISLPCLLMIMVSATITNEIAIKVKRVINSLPGVMPEHCREIKILRKGVSRHENILTMWKICGLDRSLMLSSLGTLLTYGILLGTLGKV